MAPIAIKTLHPNRRKRSRPEQCPAQPSKDSLPPKRRKISALSESQQPSAFWDNLSKIWLTKRALRELNRRSAQATQSPPSPPRRRARHLTACNVNAKRRRDCQSFQHAAEFLRCCKWKALKDVKSFARQGGPDLSDLRNFPEPTHFSDGTMSSSRSSSRRQPRDSTTPASTRPTTNTTRTKSTGVYDRDFQQHLIDNAVYPDAYEYLDGSVPTEPNNWEDIQYMLAQPRPSLSPSRFNTGEFRKFKQADAHASKEKQVSESVISYIEGKIKDVKCRSGGVPFTNLDPLTDGTLKSGNPDIYYSARPEQLNRKVREELSGQIMPSTQHDLPTALNFFLAAKGPDRSLAVAGRQACYNGALGARGMHSLQSYQQVEPIYDNNAYTITSIYHGGTLKMFTSHVGPPRIPGGRPEHYTTQLRSFAMTDTAGTFRQGAGAYRNAKDWAKEQRDDAIRQANEKADLIDAETANSDAGASPALSFVTAATETEAYTISQESRTSLYEDLASSFGGTEILVEDEASVIFPAKRTNENLNNSPKRRKRRIVDTVNGEVE